MKPETQSDVCALLRVKQLAGGNLRQSSEVSDLDGWGGGSSRPKGCMYAYS